jgi:hypothetical protein
MLTVVGILVVCTYADFLATLFQLPAPRFWLQHFRERIGELWRAHKEALLTLATLPDQARVTADAIGRTCADAIADCAAVRLHGG